MKRAGGILVAALLVMSAFAAPTAAEHGATPLITTYAGGLGAGDAANVGQTPAAVAVDAVRGFVYVADVTFNVIRRITTADGTQVVYAGRGDIGYAGDGGPATEASLGLRNPAGTLGEPPPGVAVDGAGNLYVADTQNHVIRKVDPAGVITTVAGTGTPGLQNGSASSAQFNEPSGIAVDPGGNVYIADSGNHRVRVFVAGPNAVTTIAGTGTAGYAQAENGGPAIEAKLHTPMDVARDATGNLYIADTGNCRVRKVDTSFVITTYAGLEAAGGACGYSGDGLNAKTLKLNAPRSIAVEETGALYVADTSNCLVRKVDVGGETGNVMTTVAGTPPDPATNPANCGYDGQGAATEQLLHTPMAIAVAGADVLVGDTANHRVRKLTGTALSTYAGNGTIRYSGDDGNAVEAQLYDPWGLAAGTDGSVYIADSLRHVVRKVSADGVITTIAGTGEPGYSGDGGAATAAQLRSPRGLAVTPAGAVYIADTDNCIVRRVTAAGVISTVAGLPPDADGIRCGPPTPDLALWAVTTTRLDRPNDVALDAGGDLYIADTHNHAVMRSNGSWLERVGGTGVPGSAVNQLDEPRGVAVGADGALYIADTLNHRVQKRSGTVTATFAGVTDQPGYTGDGGAPATAKLMLPYAVAAGADAVYIADTFNHALRAVTVDPATEGLVIDTFAGTGDPGFGGDGGLPAGAVFGAPHGVATSGADVFVADTLNHRVRRIGLPPPTEPTPPVDVVGAAGDGEVTVSWSPPVDDGGAAVSGYEVSAFDEDDPDQPVGETVEITGGETSATVTGLTNGVAYRVGVVARNDVGASPPQLSAPVTPRTVPDPPGAVAATAGDARAAVTWERPASDGGAAISSYQVTSIPGGRTATAGADATSVVVAGLTNGTTYTFTVRAANEAGTSAPSGASNAVTPKALAKPQPPPPPPPAQPPPASASSKSGYWMLGATGAVYAFGDAEHKGSAVVSGAAVDIEATPSGDGYWILDEAGVVQSFGDAARLGAAGLSSGERATSMSATPSGGGYWVFTSLGRVLPFGDASSFGDMAGTPLNGPVLDSVATPSGNGYYMVASDGGVFAFGDAGFHGSMGGRELNQPVQSLTADPDGFGYWLVASDGGIFAFEAPFHGSMGGVPLNQPVTRMVAFGSAGYLMVATDGGIFSFGTAMFYGSLGASPPPYPIRSVAALKV